MLRSLARGVPRRLPGTFRTLATATATPTATSAKKDPLQAGMVSPAALPTFEKAGVPVASSYTGFRQQPPTLENQWLSDPVLRSYMKNTLKIPAGVFEEIDSDLTRFGELMISPAILDDLREGERNLPYITQFDGWNRRTDTLTTSTAWKSAKRLMASEKLVSIGYEREKYGEFARVYQIAKEHIWAPSSSYFICPFGMTDAAMKLIELHGKGVPQLEEAWEKLSSTDPNNVWTTGQWMTERPGGSDVSRTESLAFPDPSHPSNTPISPAYRIHGFKWFTSAVDSDMTLLLARHVDAEGNVTPGSKGLSLFFARMRKEDGTLNGIRLHRLKDKLGTRALPTAELELDGMQATLIGPLGRGVAQMATMLNLSRLHTCVWSLGYVARALQLATDWSFRRHASGKELYRLPLHTHHLSKLSLSYRAMTLLTFHSVHLVGKTEMAVVNNGKETEDDKWLLRLLTPVSKAFVSLESVDVIRGCIEAIGGQGYMEDGTGMARLYRDTLVNTLWEGTVNALSHDLLRVFVQTRGDAGRLLMEELGRLVDGAPRELEGAALAVKEAGALIAKIGAEMMTTVSGDGKEVDPVYERLLRELTLSVGRTVAAGIMIQHANSTKDGSDIIAAQRYARAHNLIGALRDEYEAGKETSFAVGNVAGKEWIAEDPRVETGDGVVGTAFTMRTGPDA